MSYHYHLSVYTEFCASVSYHPQDETRCGEHDLMYNYTIFNCICQISCSATVSHLL